MELFVATELHANPTKPYEIAATRMTDDTCNINLTLIPPVNAHAELIGSENNTRRIKIDIDATSFPHIISNGESNVVKSAEKVWFSFSKVTEDAEKAGTSRIIRVIFALKNRAKIFRPLADATE